jgi:hypothetical protein
MSTGRKWFLALVVLSTVFFFADMFPTKVDSAVLGSDVWLVPGYHGSVGVDTGVEAIGWNWSGTLTLSARTSDGASTFTAAEEAKKDWDDTLSVTKSFAKEKTLHVSFTVTLPPEVRAGTELSGTVTGDIVTPQRYRGGFSNSPSTVDQALTFHVADQGTVTSKADEYPWPLPQWTLWLLWIPLLLFVLTTERVSTRMRAGSTPDQCRVSAPVTIGATARSDFPRWEIRSFSSAVISADVSAPSCSSGTKTTS